MFLSEDDLVKLTGWTRPSAQRKFLLDRGYPHDVNALGQPVVLQSVVQERLGGKDTPKSKLNWSAIAGGKCDDDVGGL